MTFTKLPPSLRVERESADLSWFPSVTKVEAWMHGHASCPSPESVTNRGGCFCAVSQETPTGGVHGFQKKIGLSIIKAESWGVYPPPTVLILESLSVNS